MKTSRTSDSEQSLAIFIDFENLAMGFNTRRDRFHIERILERLVEKGKIVVKRAYCDWSRFAQYTGPLHEAAIELIEIPKRSVTGKNSADIRLVVDAIDLAYSKDHIGTFVIVSGDSDFSPLVSKLKELGKHVIGIGLANATSNLLRDNCDEFMYYEDLESAPSVSPGVLDESIPEPKRKVFALLLESLLALRRENKEMLHSSMIKDTMKRKKPSFNEGYHGFNTFSDFLLEAQKMGLVECVTGKASGTLIVTRFKGESTRPNGLAPRNGNAEGGEGSKRRRRGGRSRSRSDTPAPVPRPAPAGRNGPDSDDEPLELPTYRPAPAAKAPKPAEPKPARRPEQAAPSHRPPPPPRPAEGDGFGAGLDM